MLEFFPITSSSNIDYHVAYIMKKVFMKVIKKKPASYHYLFKKRLNNDFLLIIIINVKVVALLLNNRHCKENKFSALEEVCNNYTIFHYNKIANE